MARKRRELADQSLCEARFASARWTDDAQEATPAGVRQRPGALNQFTWN
jgi:hypothetical protein